MYDLTENLGPEQPWGMLRGINLKDAIRPTLDSQKENGGLMCPPYPT